MQVHPLSALEAAQRRATHVIEITYADLTDAGATQTLSPVAIADKMAFELVWAQLVEAFVSSDAGLISTSITLGDGAGGVSLFLTDTELNAAAAEVFLKPGDGVTNPKVYTGDDTVDVYFTATVGKALNTHTAGKLRLYCNITDARAED